MREEEERENGSGCVCESGLSYKGVFELINVAVRRRLAAHRAAVAAIVPCSDRHEYACLAHDPKDLLKRIGIAALICGATIGVGNDMRAPGRVRRRSIQARRLDHPLQAA